MEERHADLLAQAKRILTDETILSLRATKLLPDLLAAIEQAWGEIRVLRETVAAQEADNEVLRAELREKERGKFYGRTIRG